MSDTRKPILLECTVRDGSYAVDFRFTERDTTVLTGLLSGLGLEWIEVGHGVGLGAAEAGKGSMPATDEALISAAKASAGDAKIGCFCIPGIATLDHLDRAREAGLDFVRIGYDAPTIEEAFPFVERSRELGLVPFVNFMKTYAIEPEDFGRKAKACADAGAMIVYCVDSAGCMMPDDVAAYITEARALTDVPLGLHAHNNLFMAMANALRAYECGADLIDTTLYGLGRSAGNIPTEVAIAVFEMAGHPTGLDLFEVMDVAEQYMRPLMKNLELYGMDSVAMGRAGFHSSFFDQVARAATAHGVDQRRLLTRMAEIDLVHLDAAALESEAAELPGSEVYEQPVLVAFDAPGLGTGTLTTSASGVDSLIDGMITSASKLGSRAVLELRASSEFSEDLLLTDLVVADDRAVVGRVTYGSMDTLDRVLSYASGSVSLLLHNLDGGSWADGAYDKMVAAFGTQAVVSFSSADLIEQHLIAVVRAVAVSTGARTGLLVGAAGAGLVDAACGSLDQVLEFSATATGRPRCTHIAAIGDLGSAGRTVDLAVLLSMPAGDDIEHIVAALSPSAVVVVDRSAGDLLLPASATGVRVVTVDPRDAYYGLVDRAAAIAAALQALGGDRDL